MSRPLIMGLGLLMLATLAFICLRLNGPKIEHDIHSHAQQTVANSGLANVRVDTSGRDITLSGTVDTDSDSQMIEQNIAALTGVRAVNNEIEVLDVAKGSSPNTGRLQIDYDGQYIALTGTVKDESIKSQLLDAASGIVGPSKVAEDLALNEASSQASIAPIMRALPLLSDLEFAQLLAEGGRIVLQGYTSNPSIKSMIENRLADQLSDDVELISMIEAPQVDDAPDNTDDSHQRPLAEQVKSCQTLFDDVMRKEKINFGTASDVINPDSQPLLQQLADLSIACPDVKIEIEGHTDTRGAAEMNRALSQRRADAVKTSLIRLGVEKQRLSAIGYGETRPIASEATADGLQKNRRIEFTIKE